MILVPGSYFISVSCCDENGPCSSFVVARTKNQEIASVVAFNNDNLEFIWNNQVLKLRKTTNDYD
jgi:hypothetical protein